MTECYEVGTNRSAEVKYSGGEENVRRHFVVHTNDPQDDYTVIMAAGQLPQKGEKHPRSARCIADVFAFEPKANSPMRWDVTIQYTTLSPGQLPQNKEIQPTLRGAKLSFGSVKFRRPLLKAYKKVNGQFTSQKVAVVNSAGVPFNPPLEVDDSRMVITVEKNFRAVPPFIIQYADAVNSDTVLIGGLVFPPGSIKAEPPSVSPLQFENNELFVTLSMIFHHNREGWDLDVLDRGYSEKLPVNLIPNLGKAIGFSLHAVQLRPIVDFGGLPITEPALLDGNGRQTKDDAAEAYLTHRPYARLPFGQLPLA